MCGYIHTWKYGWMKCVALQMVRVLLPSIGNSWGKDGIPNGEGWGSVAQITRSCKKAERDEIRKVVTLKRILLELGKTAPVVGHWWIEKEGRSQWVQKLRRGREGNRMRCTKRVERWGTKVWNGHQGRCWITFQHESQKVASVKDWRVKKVLYAGLYALGEFKLEATKYIFHYQVHYISILRKFINHKQKCTFSN